VHGREGTGDEGFDLPRRRMIQKARRRAEDIVAQGMAEAYAIRREAERERETVLKQAEAEARSQVTTAEHELNPAIAALIADAQEEAEAIIERARAEAGSIVAQAEAAADVAAIRQAALEEAEAIKAVAIQEAERIRRRREEQVLTPVHSAEIATREFPTSMRGLDQQAVKGWLSLVAASHSFLEDEVARLQEWWDALLETLVDIRTQEATKPEAAREDPWDRVVTALNEARPRQGEPRDNFETLLVRSALLETPFRRSLYGLEPSQVRRVLEDAATRLARLQHRVAVLERQNDRMRDRLLTRLMSPDALDADVRPLRQVGDARGTLPAIDGR